MTAVSTCQAHMRIIQVALIRTLVRMTGAAVQPMKRKLGSTLRADVSVAHLVVLCALLTSISALDAASRIARAIASVALLLRAEIHTRLIWVWHINRSMQELWRRQLRQASKTVERIVLGTGVTRIGASDRRIQYINEVVNPVL